MTFLFSLVFTKTKYEASTFLGCLISRMGRFYVFRKLMFAIGKAFFWGNEFRDFQKLYTEFFCLYLNRSLALNRRNKIRCNVVLNIFYYSNLYSNSDSNACSVRNSKS